MTWPVVINGNTYELADFDPYGYVTALPALFQDLLDVAGSFGATIPYNFDSSTTDADPGAGDLRLNHGTASSATAAYADNDSAAGVTVSALLDTFDDAGKTADRGILRIQDATTMGTAHFYRVTGSVTDGTGYRKLVLEWIAGNGSFTNGGAVVVSFIPRGADGSTGSTGSAGSDGNDGWSPVFAIASDGARRVLQVDDWVGGEGSKPATGDYVGASGLTSTIGDAVDIRGAAGANGSNGTNGADGADPFYLMTFDTGTSAAGISGGQVRANNADLSAASAIYVSDTNRAGSSIAARILELGAGGKTVKDRLIITNPAADTQASWLVDSITDESGYTTIAVSGHAGATSFSDDLAISLQPIMSGEDGSDGAGAGDVVGPASSTNNNIAAFDGTDGKLLKDGGIATSAIVTLNGSQTLTNKTLTSPAISTPTGLVKGDVGLGNVTNDAQIPASYLDTDTTLAANSDTKVATQKAVKAYADALIAANDAMVFKGVQDCSGNPNYPAGNRGDTYRVSVAGKIGGASGPNVEVGDMFICLTDSSSSGNHATVGSNWSIIQTNLDGAVLTTRTITSGNGLTGGGDLSSDRTLAVGAGTGIVVNADDVAVDKASDANVRACASNKVLTADLIESASAYVTLTETAGAVAVDWDSFINGKVTVDQATVISNPTSGQPGTVRTIWVLGNDGTDRAITFGNQFLGTLPTITDCDDAKNYELVIVCHTTTHFSVTANVIDT